MAPPAITDPDPEKKTTPPKRRNWRRRLAVLSALLLLFGWLLNGPVARWALHYGIEDAMASLGMDGGVSVEGTVLSGLSLHDLDYRGSEGIESVSLKRLALEYKAGELLEGRIRGLDIDNLELVIDYARFPESEASGEDGAEKVRQSLAALRPYLTAPRIGLSNVRVTLLNGGNKSARFELATLEHAAGSGVYQLNGFRAFDAENKRTPVQDTVITWQPDSATAGRLELLPDIALENATFSWASSLKGEAKLLVDGAEVEMSLTDSLSLNLTRGEIRSALFNQKLSLGLPLDFTVNSLQVDVAKWDQPIPRWKMEGHIGILSFNADEYTFSKTKLTVRQNETRYTVHIDGVLNDAAVNASAHGSWTKPSSGHWWGDTHFSYRIEGSNLANLLGRWIPGESAVNTSRTRLDATGSVKIDHQSLSSFAVSGTSTGTMASGTPVPGLQFEASYLQQGLFSAMVFNGDRSAPRFLATGMYDSQTENYTGSLRMNEPDPAWVNAIAEAFGIPVTLEKGVQLTWKGKGNPDLEKPQSGELRIGSLAFSTPDTPRIRAQGTATYEWPKSAKVTGLEIRGRDWLAKASLTWDGGTLGIQSATLTNQGEAALELTGKAPLGAEIRNTADFFRQDKPWGLRLKSDPLALKKLDTWFRLDLIKGLTGDIGADLDIAGTPAVPSVNGRIRLRNVTGLDAAQRAPLGAGLTFHSDAGRLHVTGNITEGNTHRLKGKFSLPFVPNKLINNPGSFGGWLKTAKLEGDATINTLALERFSRFVPQLEKIQGTVSGTARISGTLGDPEYSATIEAQAPMIRLRESSIGDIRDARLTATIDQTLVARTKVTASINGGKIEASGSVDLSDTANPGFDLGLSTRYALAHRDDLVSVRANADLRIKGSIGEAAISGRIGLVESVVYKDMELIPVGVPASEVAKVQLPSLDSGKAAGGLPVPAPFNRWKLDVAIATADPILIRGNIASGSVSGSLRVTGTLGNPLPDGKLVAKKVKAKLPFSVLDVERGEIRFTPGGGLDPTLSVHGKSTVGSHDVSVFVYGSASSPRTALTSYPPLPENDIMTLLATGTTTSGLEDRDVATFKAFQVFLMKLKKRAEKPGGNRLFHRMLGSVEDLNLSVGEKDRFTGRKFSSATIELHPRWHLTAQVDAQQQTRGLVVYVIRFR